MTEEKKAPEVEIKNDPKLDLEFTYPDPKLDLEFTYPDPKFIEYLKNTYPSIEDIIPAPSSDPIPEVIPAGENRPEGTEDPKEDL